MTRQPELVVWKRTPPEQRRHLVTRLGQLVARQLSNSERSRTLYNSII
jgi:predicted Fe-S protein YdhL (DUF1289 family)